MDKYIEKAFSFSKKHKQLMENDSRYISGWRYEPSLLFERGQGVKIFDVDDNEYYDLSSGMMSLPRGHAHPELSETIKEMADKFHHQSSWYSNPWAVELAELGITVNALAPGAIETELVSTMHDAETRESYCARIPVNRYGSPKEVAATAAFLVCEESSYLNGVVLPIDGGFMSGGVIKRSANPSTS